MARQTEFRPFLMIGPKLVAKGIYEYLITLNQSPQGIGTRARESRGRRKSSAPRPANRARSQAEIETSPETGQTGQKIRKESRRPGRSIPGSLRPAAIKTGEDRETRPKGTLQKTQKIRPVHAEETFREIRWPQKALGITSSAQ